MTVQNIMRIIPTIQSAALVSHNLEVVKKKDKTAKDILDLGVTNLVGIDLIKAEANLIG